MRYEGEGFCEVITEQEAFDENGDSLGIQPVNPHIITLARHGLRCSDLTSAEIADRPLTPGIECFKLSANGPEPFESADADPEVGIIWWEEFVNEQA